MVVVTTAELRLEATADEIASAAVTGQIVVVSPTTDVTTTVETAADPREDWIAAISLVAVAAGQLVTEAAQDRTVLIWVIWTVRVVCSPLAAGAGVTAAAALPEAKVCVTIVVETGTTSVEIEVAFAAPAGQFVIYELSIYISLMDMR